MPCTGIRFLLVEDHELQRNMFAQLLRTLGASEVHLAEDGRAALRVLRDPDRPVDIVVSDMSMPGMDGLEFIRNLSDSGTRVSLILASALDQGVLLSIAHMAHAYKVRLLGVMAKPPTAAKLVPMMELFRSGAPTRERIDDGFELQEIADGWAHDDFEAWLEPRVHLTTGTVRSLEVSPRWRHSTRGVLPPEPFLPSIRARGLNDDFIWLMVQKAAAHLHALQEQGHDLTVSVNLALTSLNDPRIASRVQHIVESAGVSPRRMVLSVSEAALNTDSAKSLENLARLRVLGFGVAVDDFGNGPMEAEQLALVAFTEMKIKSSFVRGADADGNARAGLAASLEIAQRLRLKTIASGISSKDEWALLREWECDYGQGPFISPPLPLAELPGWLGRRSAGRISGT